METFLSFPLVEVELVVNLADLEGRLERKAYRSGLVRRKYIPKGNRKLRPLRIPVPEDKLLQTAVTQISRFFSYCWNITPSTPLAASFRRRKKLLLTD